MIVASVDKRTRLAVALTDYVQRVFGSAKFNTNISRSTVVPDSQRARRTLFQTAPRHPVTEQYRRLAGEIEARLAELADGEPKAAPMKELVHG